MRRTTVFADEVLLEEIKAVSREEKKSVAQVLREAMEHYVEAKRRSGKELSFVSVGSSGRSIIAEKHEDLLWKEDSE
jgi:metal-responsive CopG/Arc/MetJ family transcriptional regulator